MYLRPYLPDQVRYRPTRCAVLVVLRVCTERASCGTVGLVLSERMAVQITPLNPYHLEIVPHSEVDPLNYFTMSSFGVTHFVGGKPQFTELRRWRQVLFFCLVLFLVLSFASSYSFQYWLVSPHTPSATFSSLGSAFARSSTAPLLAVRCRVKKKGRQVVVRPGVRVWRISSSYVVVVPCKENRVLVPVLICDWYCFLCRRSTRSSCPSYTSTCSASTACGSRTR